jgi:hypothetical protein
MSGKWTSGPWQIGRGPITEDRCVWGPGDPNKDAVWICGQVINHGLYADQGEANAHLIAAAPTMADVLDAAPILSKYHTARGFETEQFIADYEAWSATRRQALSQALGEGQ